MQYNPMKGAAEGNTVKAPSKDGSSSDAEDHDMAFTCNICYEGVKDKDPVVTQCGHLYCWPCLYRWLNTRISENTCPVCKAGVTTDNIIPIYIRGSKHDPRQSFKDPSTAENQANVGENGIPNRPQAHRPEPPTINNIIDPQTGLPLPATGLNVANNTQFQGMSFAAGYGFFPSLFSLQFQSFTQVPNQTGHVDEDEAYRPYLTRLMWILAASVIACLLFF